MLPGGSELDVLLRFEGVGSALGKRPSVAWRLLRQTFTSAACAASSARSAAGHSSLQPALHAGLYDAKRYAITSEQMILRKRRLCLKNGETTPGFARLRYRLSFDHDMKVDRLPIQIRLL